MASSPLDREGGYGSGVQRWARRETATTSMKRLVEGRTVLNSPRRNTKLGGGARLYHIGARVERGCSWVRRIRGSWIVEDLCSWPRIDQSR